MGCAIGVRYASDSTPPIQSDREMNWYTFSRVFVGKSGGGLKKPHKPDLSTADG